MLPAETLSLEGADALDFAQGQLACDLRDLACGSWRWAAWLDPRGRVRALAQLLRIDEARLCLLLRGGTATDLATALGPYLFRKRVVITAHATRALIDARAMPEGSFKVDGDDMVLGMGDYAMRVTPQGESPQQWRLAAIEAGHPWLPEALHQSLLGPALSLQRLGAVSLDKGCYPGQEIVARLHYRGGAKQHLWQITSARPIEPGTALTADGRPAGHMLDSRRNEATDTCQGLAVVRDASPQSSIMTASTKSSEKVQLINKL